MFYAYVFTDPSRGNEPFYVGKGRGDRFMKHFAYKTKHPNPHFGRRLAYMGRSGVEPIIKVIFVESESDAFDVEKLLIEMIGRRDKSSGTLCNMTDGGEGVSGSVVSDLVRKRMSDAAKKRGRSPEAIEKARASMMGHAVSAETRAKISAAVKKRFEDPIRMEAHMAYVKARSASPEYRARLSAAKKGKPPSAAARAATSVRRKGNPPAMAGRKHSEETKEKMRESRRLKFLDPVFAQAHADRMREIGSRPDFSDKVSQGIKKSKQEKENENE